MDMFEAGVNNDTTSVELARLFSVVNTANSGQDYEDTQIQSHHGLMGKSTNWIIEKLSELIMKLRSALTKLVKSIAGAASFSIGFTGPVLSVSVNFGS